MGWGGVGWGRVGVCVCVCVCVCVAKPVAVELRCHATALIFDWIFILAGNEDNYKSLDEFEIRRNSTTDFRVSCP